MKVLFENHYQATKVRIVLWGLMVVGVVAVICGWMIFESYGLAPGDGGVLKPFAERLAMGGFVAGFGLACALGMMLYASLYVLKLTRRDDEITIETLSPWGVGMRQHVLSLADIGGSKYHHGRLTVPRSAGDIVFVQRVNAPWMTLKVRDQRLPFILDAQAEKIDINALSALAR